MHLYDCLALPCHGNIAHECARYAMLTGSGSSGHRQWQLVRRRCSNNHCSLATTWVLLIPKHPRLKVPSQIVSLTTCSAASVCLDCAVPVLVSRSSCQQYLAMTCQLQHGTIKVVSSFDYRLAAELGLQAGAKGPGSLRVEMLDALHSVTHEQVRMLHRLSDHE